MSVQITAAFVEQFRSNVQIQYQQEMSKFRNAVRVETGTGKSWWTERIGPTAMIAKAARHGDTPLVNTPHSTRRLDLVDYEWADMIDDPDKVRLLIDPQGPYVRNARMAANRTIDDVVITAFDAAAVAGDVSGKETTSTVALPAGQQIAEANTGLTLGKIVQAHEILNGSDVPTEDRWFAISPAALTDILNDTTITSADYNSMRLLMTGQISQFMGFNWILSTRLPVDANDIRFCFAWHKRSMVLGLGKDVIARVSERADKSYSVQAFVGMTIGAVRVEEEGVVQVGVDETPD